VFSFVAVSMLMVEERPFRLSGPRKWDYFSPARKTKGAKAQILLNL